MSLRYSIYKVQTRCFALADSFLILSHSVPFVKNFFQVFVNFSEGFSARCSREQLRYVSTSASICQALFSKTFKFLSDSLFIWAARKRPAYISIRLLFCQALFFQFLNFFILGSYCPLHRGFCLLFSLNATFCEGFLSLRESESDKIPQGS